MQYNTIPIIPYVLTNNTFVKKYLVDSKVKKEGLDRFVLQLYYSLENTKYLRYLLWLFKKEPYNYRKNIKNNLLCLEFLIPITKDYIVPASLFWTEQDKKIFTFWHNL